MNKDIHEVQASILRELLFHNGTNFAALNKIGITNDHFTFHIKQLMKEGIKEDFYSHYPFIKICFELKFSPLPFAYYIFSYKIRYD